MKTLPSHSARISFIALTLILVLTSHMRAQINADQVTIIGRNVLSMDDYMLAIQYFNQAIKAKPYLAEPYFLRAIAKLNLDDYKGAEEDCTLAIERNKFKTEAYKVRGFARQSLGKDSLAIEDYNIGLQYNPLDKYFLFYKGIAQIETKQFDGADSTFNLLLRQYPKFEEGFTARGRLNLEKGDTLAAIDDIDHAISLSKSQINPYLLKAEIRWKQKNWDEASEAMDAAIRLRPEIADLYVNRAFIRYNADDYFGAMSDYNYALELQPDNTSALFNRALLRYEVKDLQRAEEDLSAVLRIDPGNFHALYNRGLINLELEKNNEALGDFNIILNRYPRFYPVYYAIAQARKNMGDLRSAAQMVMKAEQLVENYVENPEKNPLDRPVIAASESNEKNRNSDDSPESETEIMERFNRLVTVAQVAETPLPYNEKIKGRVQDRNVNVDIEPVYAISFNEPETSLKLISNYFKELDDLNRLHLISNTIYLTPASKKVNSQEMAENLFELAEKLTHSIESGSSRPIDRLALGITQTMLKNYSDALSNLDDAIAMDPRFVVAYMARGFTRYADALAQLHLLETNHENEENMMLDRKAYEALLQESIRDFDTALQLNPRLIYAWFNKGNIFYGIGDFTSALQCYSEALRIDPDFGQAYFNRGLTYLQAGNRNQAFADLSKAGELGVLPSYNILKRMK